MGDTGTGVIGRERHLREVQLLIDGLRAGNGYAVLFSGEAGAGKTSLANEAARVAQGAGVTVGWATCWRDVAAPLGAWSDLTEAVLGSGEMPDPPDRASDPDGARALWIRALGRHLVSALGTTPTLLVVDDLHWADPLSLRSLEVLVGLLRSRPVGLLCTARDDAGTADAGLDRIAATSRHLVVPPMTEAELGVLAIELTGHEMTRGSLARLHDRTAGNVLFARELLLQGTAGRALVGQRGSSTSATMELFSERVARLTARCQQVLEAASVIGRRFRVDFLAEALATDVDELLDLLGEAGTEGLVRAAGLGGFEFSHPLVAESCYQRVGLPRRIRLHRDVAEAMERMRSRGIAVAATEIAHHFSHAAAAGVADKAAEYAALAGRDDMEQLAYEDAVRDFGLALKARELCAADDEVLAELLLELADALAATGDRVAARERYERAASLARHHSWPDVLARAALGVGSGPGGFEVPPFDDRQIALLEEAAATAEGRVRPLVLARLSVALALDPRAAPRRQALSEQAIGLARRVEDSGALGYALASWCDVVPGPDAVEDRLAAAEEILASAASIRDIGLELLGRRLRVVALLEVGRIDEVDSEVAAYTSSAGRIGQPAYSWYVPLWQAMRACMDGHFDTAERLRAAAEVVGASAHSENARMLVASQRAMVKCELRDSLEAVPFFEALMERYPDYSIMARPAVAYASAAGGDIGRAAEIVATLDVDACTVDALGSEFLTTLFLTAHAGWLAGCDDHAGALYGALLPHRSRFAIDGIGGYFAGSVERTLAVLAAQRNDRDLARQHFAVALLAHRRVRSPLLVAATLRDAGACLDDEAMASRAAAAFGALGLGAGPAAGPAPTIGLTAVDGCSFRREGDGWVLAWHGKVAHVRHTKGMADLARLLARPHTEVHVLDLVDVGPTLETGPSDDGIDPTARRQYRARLEDIESELDEADGNGDVARSERLHLEREALLAELSTAYGLGGRTRRRGGSSERARSAVTQRIRDAIIRIEGRHPELGHHLRRSVRTGTFCAYQPETPVEWRL